MVVVGGGGGELMSDLEKRLHANNSVQGNKR